MLQEAGLLRSLPYFASLTAEEMRKIEQETREISFSKGEIILLEGEPCPGLFVVKSGQVRVFKASPSGREQVLFMALPGGTFNDAPVFDGGPNLASAEARQASTVYLVPRAVMQSLIADCPAAGGATLVLARRLRSMTELVENLALSTVASRLSKLLLDLAVVEEGTSPMSSLTQDDMASMIGSVRDVVGRTLRDLQKIGAIKIEGRRILIVAPDRLRDVVEMSDKSRSR
ncbi:MAG: Crp/Fnr family transcriptional regulator [Chloroflexi bacterium]|nr:Crp/Fnr family transcriptional regulator [Chloroflexota bacterium]